MLGETNLQANFFYSYAEDHFLGKKQELLKTKKNVVMFKILSSVT